MGGQFHPEKWGGGNASPSIDARVYIYIYMLLYHVTKDSIASYSYNILDVTTKLFLKCYVLVVVRISPWGSHGYDSCCSICRWLSYVHKFVFVTGVDKVHKGDRWSLFLDLTQQKQWRR